MSDRLIINTYEVVITYTHPNPSTRNLRTDEFRLMIDARSSERAEEQARVIFARDFMDYCEITNLQIALHYADILIRDRAHRLMPGDFIEWAADVIKAHDSGDHTTCPVTCPAPRLMATKEPTS